MSNEITNTPIGIFALRINNMMREYNISFVKACEWDALGFMPGHPMNVAVTRAEIYEHYLAINCITGPFKNSVMAMLLHKKADVTYKQINK